MISGQTTIMTNRIIVIETEDGTRIVIETENGAMIMKETTVEVIVNIQHKHHSQFKKFSVRRLDDC